MIPHFLRNGSLILPMDCVVTHKLLRLKYYQRFYSRCYILTFLLHQVQVPCLDFLQQLAVCHLTMWRPRFRRCNLMPTENIHTPGLLIVLPKPSKQEDRSNFTPDSLSIVLGLPLMSWYFLMSHVASTINSLLVFVLRLHLRGFLSLCSDVWLY